MNLFLFFNSDMVQVNPLSKKGVFQIPKRTYQHIITLPGIRQAYSKMSNSKRLPQEKKIKSWLFLKMASKSYIQTIMIKSLRMNKQWIITPNVNGHALILIITATIMLAASNNHYFAPDIMLIYSLNFENNSLGYVYLYFNVRTY